MIGWLEKKRLVSVVFLLLIAIEIFWFSSLPGGGKGSNLPNFATLYHFSVFFLFAFFLISLIKGKTKLNEKIIFIAVIISVAYAILDEIHQFYIPGRSCSIADLLTDSAGIFFSVLIYLIYSRKDSNRLEKAPFIT